VTLILCRLSLGDTPFDWAGLGCTKQRMSWPAWRDAGFPENRETNTFTRLPPRPTWQTLDKNQCPICGQPTFAGGAWWPEAGAPRWNLQWHTVCAAAYQAWRHPDFMAQSLADRQGGKCSETGADLFKLNARGDRVLVGGVEVDHRVPLWRVRRDAHLYVWPDVLRMWGPTNLQVLVNAGHKLKTAREARERASKQ
jgi:hypothetical protein